MSRKNDRFKQLQLPRINDTKNKQNKTSQTHQKEGMGGLGSTLSIKSTVLQAPFHPNKNSSKIFAELKILETKHVEPQKMIKHVYIYI